MNCNDQYMLTHAHTDVSNFKTLDSTIKVKELIDYALELNLAGVSITDHETLSNHVEAIKYIKELREQKNSTIPKDFKLALGNEIYLTRDNLSLETYLPGFDKYYHFILIAKDEVGHKQLRQLSSRAWVRQYRQFIERVPTYYKDIEEIVGANKGHIIATTACLGGLFPKLYEQIYYIDGLESEMDIEEFIFTNYLNITFDKESLEEKKTKVVEVLRQKIDNFISWCKSNFGDDFYIELQPSKTEEQRRFNKYAYNYAKENHIASIFATDAHYLKEEDRLIHKAFLNSRDGEREIDAFYSTTYVMSFEEIKKFLSLDFTEEQIEEMRQNSLNIREKIEDYDLFHKSIIPHAEIPDFDLKVPKNMVKDREYVTKFLNSTNIQDRYLLYLIIEGVDKKYEPKDYDAVYDRIELELSELYEISINIEDNMASYLLIVRKIIDIIWSDGNSLVGPSRGSALGFVIDYLIDVTQISPLFKEIPLPHWRFISRDRGASLPDIDIDTESFKRQQIMAALRKHFGEYNVFSVATFKTEKAKSAIQTAGRGLGMNNDDTQFISSLIPSERGEQWTLQECYHGNPDKDRKAIPAFIKEMDAEPILWKTAQRIESLITGRSSHAGGVIVTNTSIVDHSAIMRTPKGEMIIQYNLGDAEYMGLVKFDLLSVEALDGIRASMDLLEEYKYIENQGGLRPTYDKYFHPDVINYTEPEMWRMAYEGKILSLFQFDTPVGGDAIRRTKPTSLLEMASINSIMRLMSSGGGEMPLDTYIKQKEDLNTWYSEMDRYELTQKEQDIMTEHLKLLYGVADSQESAMLMVMDKRISGFSLGEADKLRKGIAKKKPEIIEGLKTIFFEKGLKLKTSPALLNYVWNIQLKRQFGYSFSSLHTWGYSTIAVIQMNISYFYPPIFWQTARLIVEAGGAQDEEEDYGYVETEEIEEEESFEGAAVSTYERKAKIKNNNYDKISIAIGKVQQEGVIISPPDINNSKFIFAPDVENNTILFGLKGIARLGEELISAILKLRPFDSLEDFIEKLQNLKLEAGIGINKVQIINLIKSGAFDKLEQKERQRVLASYIQQISDTKNTLNLRNMPMLIKNNLLPKVFEQEKRIFNFNVFIKKNSIDVDNTKWYELDNYSVEFFEQLFDGSLLQYTKSGVFIEEKVWKKLYDKAIKPIKEFLKDNEEYLSFVNNFLIQEQWNKYCKGTISTWEIDSMGFYYNPHELIDLDTETYEVRDFFLEPEIPIIISSFTTPEGKTYHTYDNYYIAGTVIGKDKGKNTISLLTTSGVVTVQIFKNQFSLYDKQISEMQEDGTKKTIEKSWFTRGNKLFVGGFKSGDKFFPRVYKKRGPAFPIQLISKINNDGTVCFAEKRL